MPIRNCFNLRFVTFRHEDGQGATSREHPNLENSASQGEASNALECFNGFHSQKTARNSSTKNSKKRMRNEENSQALEVRQLFGC